MTTNLKKTVTPRGTRYYVDLKRVSREDYEAARYGRRLDCFITRIKGDTIKHFCLAH